jgi:ABC-type polysaccharide/polyol phosphate transport system ATPase subunit
MTSGTAITCQNLSKSYFLQEDRTFKEMLPGLLFGKKWAKQKQVFADLNFEIPTGQAVGIVGRNGAGKSTLLKLIAGVTAPTTGTLRVNGQVAPLIELGAGFHHELSGYENIFLNAAILGMKKAEINKKVQSIIDFSELAEFIHVPVKRYSSGMYMRLGFAVAIHTNAPILLVDEVLAVGDAAFQKKCLHTLRDMRDKQSKTIIFVSHDERAVRDFCQRALLLEDGKLVADGTPEKIFEHYHEKDEDTSVTL